MPTRGIYARLLRAAKGRRPTVEDAEDLVQEAYARLIEYRRNVWVRDEESFLRRVVHNLAVNQYHHEHILTFVSEASAELETVPDDGPTIEELLTARQRLEQLAAMLTAASRRTCEIFLAHRAGFMYEEIAEESGVSTRTVKKHISRAKALLGCKQRGALDAAEEKWRSDGPYLKGYPRAQAAARNSRSGVTSVMNSSKSKPAAVTSVKSLNCVEVQR